MPGKILKELEQSKDREESKELDNEGKEEEREGEIKKRREKERVPYSQENSIPADICIYISLFKIYNHEYLYVTTYTHAYTHSHIKTF